MNRHHPYAAGPYDSPPVRRGGSPSGPGPDRAHTRFPQDRGGPPRGRGGFARGRGGYGGYDGGAGHGAYDQGPPPGDMPPPYTNYNDAPQDPFYQNDGYGGAPPPNQYGGPPGPSDGGYNQGYGNFEDGPGSNFEEGGYGQRPKRNIRREKDDKVHDSIIEERIQRERPCRTLFIRNIKYETNSDDVRRQFEEHGEIKTFFDLISTRGMVFVTYFDLRAAERARERLQGSEISGRPIDVHYSLPRDDSRGGGDKNQQQLQGTLQVFLRNSASGQPIDDNELRRKFQQFGDVKSVNPMGDRSDQRYVEFYDTRACDQAFDRLRHQTLQDGVMDIAFAWDNTADSTPPSNQRRDDRGHDSGRDWEERGPSRGRGGRGRGRGRGRGYDEGGYDRRDDWDRDRGRGRFDDDYGGRGGRGGGRGGAGAGGGSGGYGGGYDGDRYENRGGGHSYGGLPPGPPGSSGPPPMGYGGPSNTTNGYGAPPPPTAAPPVDERVEQARKVQQLLAALKQPQPAPPPTTGPPPLGAFAGPPPMSLANTNGYYPPPSALHRPPFPGSLPPPPSNTNSYVNMPPPSSAPQPAQTQPSLASLPPNILALLQQSQAQPPALAVPQYGMPGQQMMTPATAAATPAANYNQLMAFLQNQASNNGPK